MKDVQGSSERKGRRFTSSIANGSFLRVAASNVGKYLPNSSLSMQRSRVGQGELSLRLDSAFSPSTPSQSISLFVPLFFLRDLDSLTYGVDIRARVELIW